VVCFENDTQQLRKSQRKSNIKIDVFVEICVKGRSRISFLIGSLMWHVKCRLNKKKGAILAPFFGGKRATIHIQSLPNPALQHSRGLISESHSQVKSNFK